MPFHGDIVYLYLGKGCNSNCYFCVANGKKEKELSTEQVKNKLLYAQKRGLVDLVLSGGEATTVTDRTV